MKHKITSMAHHLKWKQIMHLRSFKSYWLLAIVFIFPVNEAYGLECWKRIEFQKDVLSNKCVECQKLNLRNGGQPNCKFFNPDRCCESNSCDESSSKFPNWMDGICELH